MRYMLSIFVNEADLAQHSESEMQQLYAEYGKFSEEAQQRGLMLSGEALQPTVTATTVRVRDGETVITDGPFAETKEQFGGFYLLNCKDLEEAIEMAAKIPGAKFGTVEIRPVIEFG
jgi:hypothetical protein